MKQEEPSAHQAAGPSPTPRFLLPHQQSFTLLRLNRQGCLAQQFLLLSLLTEVHTRHLNIFDLLWFNKRLLADLY